MTALLWRCRYVAEDRRRMAAARGHYAGEAAWSLVLVLLCAVCR
jgi:hypothetical protein